MPARANTARVLLLATLALVAIAGAALVGPTPLPPADILDIQHSRIFWPLRVPRTLLAAAAGAALATGGVVFQALFRNPLAEPYTLGVASGASLAAAIGFLCGLGSRWSLAALVGIELHLPELPVLAFVGALGAIGLVYLMARFRGQRDMTHLLLAGVCVAYLSSAGVLLVTFLADRVVTNDIVKWMMGSLAGARPTAAAEVGVALLIVWLAAAAQHRALDLLALGDDVAASRGVPVSRVVWSCYLLVGLLTAVVVANCGPIGFVGLMLPHMTRAVVGARTLPLLGGAALGGAAFLAWCDAIGRSVRVYELPVGVITNLIGAGFFFYLLARTDIAMRR
ncbi:Hemin transport system permease protein HmuU [Phycisphaerae bacterium RAS1]|nr:Hemin transport system permease protein HmuU [Phycisphaerae bacterium RAS1]